MISKETYKEAVQFKNQMGILGLIMTPLGYFEPILCSGVILLMIYFNMRSVIKEYDIEIARENDD